MLIRQKKSMLILVTLVLLSALLILVTCSVGHSRVPELSDGLIATDLPEEDELIPEANQDVDEEDEVVDEVVDDNNDEPDDEIDWDSIYDDFEIFSIEGTADSITGDSWDRMLTWRSNATLLGEQNRDIVFVNMNPAENVVYLTFDDGPDSRNTVRVIDTLIEYDVSATFFFTGENIRRHGEVVKKAFDAGFPIGLHGYSHTSFLNMTADEIIAELNETNDLLEAITGERATMMRPPYGAMGEEEIEIISSLNLDIYLWSLDTLDWAQTEETMILQNIKDHLRPGEIILMHSPSGQRLVPEILPAIIEFIRDEGYEMKALP